MESKPLTQPEIFVCSQQRANTLLTLLQQTRLERPAQPESASRLEVGIASAAHFFRQALHSFGFWSDFHGVASGGRDWISAYVGCTLARLGLLENAEIDRVVRLLLQDRYPSGAWGYRPGLPADMDSTSWAVLFLQALEADWDSAKTLNLLLSHEDANTGGIRTYLGPEFGIADYVGAGPQDDLSGWCSAHTCVTAAALQALLACGFTRQHPAVGRLIQFLLQAQQPEGFWYAHWYRGQLYATLQVVRALLRAGAAPDLPALQRAARWVESAQLPDGSWSDGIHNPSGRVVDTAFAICARLELENDSLGRVEQAVEWLLQRQRPDGSWDSLPILQLPAANEHQPWRVKDWPQTGGALTQGVCVPDRNRFFTTATALQALGAWRRRIETNHDERAFTPTLTRNPA